MEGRSSFNEQFQHFRSLDPANVRPPATFLFLAQYVRKLEKNYRSNPSLYHLDSSSTNMGVKAVHYATSNAKPKHPRLPSGKNPIPPKRPCPLCTAKGFQSVHYPLNPDCGASKLSSPEILKIISDSKVCPSCIYMHDPAFPCRLTFHNGASKVCTRGCQHDGFPVHRRACMHNNHTPTVSVSKVSFNKYIPLVESVNTGSSSIGI